MTSGTKFVAISALALVSLQFTGCGKAESSQSIVVAERRDSSGVALIHYAELPPIDSAITLAAVPRITIGHSGAGSAYELFDVAGATRLSDGRVVVANGGSNELRWYGPDGTFLTSVGGEGAGPGEFRMLTWLGRGPGDTLVTADPALGRLQVFTPDGQYVRTLSLADLTTHGFSRPQPAGILPDGSIVAVLFTLPKPRVDGPQRDPQLIGRLGSGLETWDSLWVLAGPEQIVAANDRGGVSMTSFVFGAYPDIGVGPSGIATVNTELFGFDLVSTAGGLRTRVSIEGPSVPVTHAILSTYVESSLEQWPPGASENDPSAFRRRIIEGPHAAVLPRVRSVEVDRVGRVWLELYAPPGSAATEFAAFTPNGDWIGRVLMPEGLDRGTHASIAPGLEIGEDYVLGVWRDANGVESVRMYDLHMGSAH